MIVDNILFIDSSLEKCHWYYKEIDKMAANRLPSCIRRTQSTWHPNRDLEDLEDLVELAEQPSSGSSSVRASILSQLAQLTWSGTLSAAPGVPLDLVGRAVEVFGESDERGLPLVLVQQSLMLERSGARRSATEALLEAGELFAAEPRAPEPPSVAAFRRARSAWCRARARRSAAVS